MISINVWILGETEHLWLQYWLWLRYTKIRRVKKKKGKEKKRHRNIKSCWKAAHVDKRRKAEVLLPHATKFPGKTVLWLTALLLLLWANILRGKIQSLHVQPRRIVRRWITQELREVTSALTHTLLDIISRLQITIMIQTYKHTGSYQKIKRIVFGKLDMKSPEFQPVWELSNTFVKRAQPD